MLNFRHILPFLLFTSCTAPFSEKEIPEREEGAHFYITVENPETKSLNGTIAESWEKKINTAYIYIFQAATGQLLYLHTLNSSNINALNSGTNNTVSFIVPINGSQNCNVYMVANTLPSGSTSTESSFLASIEQDITSYNGKYTDVTTKALRPQGFVMTASSTGVTLTNGNNTSINLTLKRIVAKIGIEINLTAVISLGTSVVTDVTISQSAPVSNLFLLATGNTTGSPISLTQTAQQNTSNTGIYNAFFYIYENDARNANVNRVKLTFKVVNTTVLNIQTTYTYNTALNGNGNGKFTRNKGYFITAKVNKLINILSSSPSKVCEIHAFNE
ncbi:hypothetical protein [Odoribacter sp. Z80]|uniref:hypothetical protein n=1 Tax=Odoribacter sp. Z80 TaxID=2304575 RepID=UPI001379790A|nr:hypothetical protein [Odoribacter sp. Z80]NCE72283.1 hypothetical protein [Odoribacter sp. Z80]